jgi:beta-aspartyl-peptidase (threonine type)
MMYTLPVRVLLLVFGLTLLGLFAVIHWLGPPSRNLAPADREAIRQVLERQAAAWNAGELEAFMEGYWRSPELTFFSGKEPQHGWEATLERYRKRYQAPEKEMGHLTFSDLVIEETGPHTAWVRGRWQVETSKETLGGLFTLIFKRLPEGWRIVHDHTSG